MATAVHTGEARSVVALLGGRSVFRRDIPDLLAFQEMVREGLPYGAMEALFLDFLEIHRKEAAGLLGIAERTLARRKHARHLTPAESDRLYRVAHAAWRATEVLGSREKAKRWLGSPNRALGGAAPLGVLDTEIGRAQVEELLHRIDHGIHS